jgi:aminocarboxymuconate-semialdehyde decarboxylase
LDETKAHRRAAGEEINMRIIDTHFHWWPRPVLELMCKAQGFPHAEPNAKGGFSYWRKEGDSEPGFNSAPHWFDLEKLLGRMDELDNDVSVISSIGPLSTHFTDASPKDGYEQAMLWNEEMAGGQRKYPGRFWGTAAVPFHDAKVAIEVTEHAVKKLGLVGVNVPGAFGYKGACLDAAYLEPFYDRVEELSVPIFIHPTDVLLSDLLTPGYDGALYLGLGRLTDVSVAASRLIYSGIMERHPNLKVYMSHTGGVLPYQSGRMDKSFSKGVKLPHPTSTYIKRMMTDTVSPHTPGMKFAIEYYGADHVFYGTDYPCWNPSTAIKLFEAIGLSTEDQQKIFYDNARDFFGLRERVRSDVMPAA